MATLIRALVTLCSGILTQGAMGAGPSRTGPGTPALAR